jgi:hypothetical protein
MNGVVIAAMRALKQLSVKKCEGIELPAPTRRLAPF